MDLLEWEPCPRTVPLEVETCTPTPVDSENIVRPIVGKGSPWK